MLACIAYGLLSIYALSAQEAPPTEKPILSPSTISFFATFSPPAPSAEKAAMILSTPGKLAHSLVKEELRRPVTGLWAAYGGMCAYSDYQGQITFPRRHIGEEITFVITQKIKPIILSGNTVTTFVVAESAPCAYFIVRRRATKDLFYWETERIDIPTSRAIPPFAIILFAKPQEIIMNNDLVITNGSPNLLLPPIEVSRATSLAVNTLLFFKVNQYFAPVVRAYRVTDNRFATLLIP